jgi:hypothetical protein
MRRKTGQRVCFSMFMYLTIPMILLSTLDNLPILDNHLKYRVYERIDG